MSLHNLIDTDLLQTFGEGTIVPLKGAVGTLAADIAVVETSPTTAAHAVGDLLIYGGVLYKAKTAIAVGAALTVGTNIEATTVATEVKNSGSAITVDSELSTTSENPVQNKVITSALSGKVDSVSGKGLSTEDFTSTYKSKLDNIDTTVTASSSNLVTSGAVKTAVDAKWTAADATTSSKGIVQVGSGLEVSSGIITVPSATTSSAGIVTKTASITSGSTDVPTSGAVYTALQGVGGAIITPLADLRSNFSNIAIGYSYGSTTTIGIANFPSTDSNKIVRITFENVSITSGKELTVNIDLTLNNIDLSNKYIIFNLFKIHTNTAGQTFSQSAVTTSISTTTNKITFGCQLICTSTLSGALITLEAQPLLIG